MVFYPVAIIIYYVYFFEQKPDGAGVLITVFSYKLLELCRLFPYYILLKLLKQAH